MDHAHLFEEIQTLLAADSGEAAVLVRMEETLTVGYARALALEAERWRLERRIAEIASGLDREDTGELAGLAQRMTDAHLEVVRLRAALSTLRDRASAVRSAA